MVFDFAERSNNQGNTISLYEFRIGTTYWRYSSDVEDTELGDVTYEACAISDNGITMSGDAENDDLSITMPATVEFPLLFRGTPPSNEIWVTVRRKQVGDDDAPVEWLGTLSNVKQTGLSAVVITCHQLTASFNRNGLRLSWGRQCPHALYDRNCKVDKSNFVLTLQVTAVSGAIVESPALATLPSGYLSNGFFEWERYAGILERRPIENHNGAQFSILGVSDGLKIGDWVNAYPGCNRTTDHCVKKFNNLSNYGGIPHLPGKSPFDGDPVF